MLNYSKAQVKKLSKIADQILSLEERFADYTDEEIQVYTDDFKEKLKNGATLESILVEAFAVCREITWRILGKRQYKVQIIAGIALHQGRVIEMKTGEGKTLTELCPAYLNALTGKGVHVITVNDYLAKRDFEEMAPVYEFLGLTVGLVIDGSPDKKLNYSKDITYSTNTELGFDYLRDNTVYNYAMKVQRGLEFVIIDEVDSVLIDEARTPLIISADNNESVEVYSIIDKIIKNLDKKYYEIDFKLSTIYLNGEGSKHIEKILGINLLDSKYAEQQHIINQALRANFLMKKERDYIVSNNEVILIDLGTGRIADGRRFSNGLHQAIEAKEGVLIQKESDTIASITYQNFFGLYKKVSGMSGTVMTEEKEFQEIYNLDIVKVPTNKPIQRIDKEDIMFYDKKSKVDAIINDIQETHAKGQPILVCAQSINEAEFLSSIMVQKEIPHKLLTAKTLEVESEIIAKAGELNSITVSTNIAGRGTDIKIPDESLAVGGLKVIGTEHSPIKRVDNQLIGRSGRQGNIGESQFYVSLEDELFITAQTNFVKKYIEKHKDENLTGKIDAQKIKKQVISAQRMASGMAYLSRKDTVKYDQVLNLQRSLIYSERDEILQLADTTDYNKILEFIAITILHAVQLVTKKHLDPEDIDYLFYTLELKQQLIKTLGIDERHLSILDKYENESYLIADEVDEDITNHLIREFAFLLEGVNFNEVLNHILGALLYEIDIAWIDHLNTMELLKIIVRDSQYNQKKPEDMYKLEAYKYYNDMRNNVLVSFIRRLFNSTIVNYKQNQNA